MGQNLRSWRAFMRAAFHADFLARAPRVFERFPQSHERVRVRVALPGLVHLNYYKPRSKKYGPFAGCDQINLRGEMLAISRREATELRKMFELIVARLWREHLEKA